MKHLIATTLAASMLTALSAHSQILVNGGFENEPEAANPNSPPQGPGYLFLTDNQIPGWTVAAGHYATMHENPGPWLTISGSYSLNTDGEGQNGNNVDIYQDFASVTGNTYSFAFDWENWQNNAGNSQLQISITDLTTSASLFDQFYGQGPEDIDNHVATTFVGTGDALRLEIQETPQTGYNDNTWVVDNFDVENTTVPDNTAWAAELIALASLAGLAIRTRRVQA